VSVWRVVTLPVAVVTRGAPSRLNRIVGRCCAWAFGVVSLGPQDILVSEIGVEVV
jgi:hypothetical protein